MTVFIWTKFANSLNTSDEKYYQQAHAGGNAGGNPHAGAAGRARGGRAN